MIVTLFSRDQVQVAQLQIELADAPDGLMYKNKFYVLTSRRQVYHEGTLYIPPVEVKGHS